MLAKPELRARGYVQATVGRATAGIAYVLFEDAWGYGLASEAVEAMLVHLRDAYAVHSAHASVDPRNHRSIRLLVRLGFALAQTRTGAAWLHGVVADEAEYTLQLSE